jgi:hypothetical protein
MASSDFYSFPNLLMRLNNWYILLWWYIVYRHFFGPRMTVLEYTGAPVIVDSVAEAWELVAHPFQHQLVVFLYLRWSFKSSKMSIPYTCFHFYQIILQPRHSTTRVMNGRVVTGDATTTAQPALAFEETKISSGRAPRKAGRFRFGDTGVGRG